MGKWPTMVEELCSAVFIYIVYGSTSKEWGIVQHLAEHTRSSRWCEWKEKRVNGRLVKRQGRGRKRGRGVKLKGLKGEGGRSFDN